MRKQNTSRKGFTIGELMVGIAVLGILAAGAVIVYGQVTAAAKAKRLADNVSSFNKAIGNFISAGGAIDTTANGAAITGTATTDGTLAVGGADATAQINKIQAAFTNGIYAGGILHQMTVDGTFTPANYTVTTTGAVPVVAAAAGAVTP